MINRRHPTHLMNFSDQKSENNCLIVFIAMRFTQTSRVVNGKMSIELTVDRFCEWIKKAFRANNDFLLLALLIKFHPNSRNRNKLITSWLKTDNSSILGLPIASYEYIVHRERMSEKMVWETFFAFLRQETGEENLKEWPRFSFRLPQWKKCFKVYGVRWASLLMKFSE